MSEIGIKVHRMRILMLRFAPDIVLYAESEPKFLLMCELKYVNV